MNEKTEQEKNEAKPKGANAPELINAVSGCLKLEWIIRRGDGYSCENLYVNKMKIAGYHHKVTDYKENPYRMYIYLPAIKKDKEWFDFVDKIEGKKNAEDMVRHWFMSALNCR
jgi:hypothetical protein